jgi:hypothetical protein
MGTPAVEARHRFTTCAVTCPAPTNCGIVPDRSYWISGSYAPPWSEKRTSFLKAIEKERLQGGKGDNNGVGRHRHSHAPGIQQEPPLIVRQVSSHAASSGCSLPARSLPSRSRAGGPAAASACSHLGLVLADSPARHGFCSFSLAEAEKPRQDALGCGWGEATGAFRSERDTHAIPLRHTPSGPTEAHCPRRSMRVYCHWSPRTCRWRRPRRVRPIHPGPVAVGRGRSGCLSEAHTHARHACHA